MSTKSAKTKNHKGHTEKLPEPFCSSTDQNNHHAENINSIVLNLDQTPLPDLSPLESLKKTKEALAKISHALLESTQFTVPITQHVIELLSECLNSIQNQWFQQFAELGKSLERFFSYFEIQAEEIAPKLQEAGLWISPNMSYGLISETIVLCKNPDSTPQELHKLFIDHYSRNEYALIIGTVNIWKTNPDFIERMEVVADALDAHINHKFTLSIPALLPVIEGVATDISGKSAGHPAKRIKEVIGDHCSEVLHAASRDVLLNLLDEIGFFEPIKSTFFSSEKYSEFLVVNGIEEEECLNRHAILHGVQKKYASEINSLKAFLILDMLSDLERSTENE